MSANTLEKRPMTKRQQEVAAIVARHSNKIFGHANATIREIRLMALKQRLEKVFDANS